MSEFKNVTIEKQANYYFDGNVTSRTIVLSDGSKKTLGIMLPGEYEFNTSFKEIIEITSGELEVLISEEDGWKEMSEGMSFEVPKNSSFKLKVSKIFDYCCSYLEK
ncbi:pyrimidine/purine nucleoside phosphorylase [Gammaproteobacteria bacterium]|nr:pyrimidine/purine nucleoside phosphorylase [Gammaproteobacteria bacterium]